MKRKHCYLIALILYFSIIFFFAVLSRETAARDVRLNLFQGYVELVDNSCRDILVNITVFIPVGLMAGLMTERYRLLKSIFAGLLFSLTIEISQLLLRKGTFDVDDIFNNTVGALLGGAIALMVLRVQKVTTQKYLT